jgi:hypothetical protein
MASFQLDEHTAKQIEEQAQARGISVVEYLQSLMPSPTQGARPTWDEIEREIVALSMAGAGLPAEFSRADIYHDHD